MIHDEKSARRQAYKFVKAKDIFHVAKNFGKQGFKVIYEDSHTNVKYNELGYTKRIVVAKPFQGLVIHAYYKEREPKDEFKQDVQVQYWY